MKKVPIRRVSKKRAKELTQYFKLRNEYLEALPICGVCKEREAFHIHHKNKRNNARLNDQKYWVGVCASCHSFIHDHPEAARKEGWLL